MGDLASTCKDKLAYFRIKELKDVLTHLSLPKHGNKQELVDRVLALLSDDHGVCQWRLGWGKKNVSNKEAVAKIVDDIYRKMNVHGPPYLLSHSQSEPDFNRIKHKKEADDSCQLDTNVRCLCGQTFLLGNVVKCDDHRCQVQQHMGCVLIPDNPTEGIRPEVPSHFYCQLCRLSRADPFLVTVGNPLLPVRLMSSGVVNDDGTFGSQSVDKTFQLSRTERETVQRVEYDLQVWCMLLNDKVQFRMHWPQHADLQVNGIPVQVIPRPSSQLLGSNGRDDGPVITTLCHEGQNKIFLSSADSRPFCFGIRIAMRRTVDQVLNLVPKEADGESFEDSLARVRRCLRGGNTTDDADSDSDLEVVADFFPVSLRCPNSGSRIRTAGRFKPCVHMGCFDLQTFVELNQRSRKWQCPTCLKNYSVENMIIDQYFNQITSLLQNCNGDINEIHVKPDGSWRVKGDVENRELAQWHMPDGSLLNLKQATKRVAGHVKQFKKESDYDGSKGLKIESKSNINGIWEVSSTANDKNPPVTVNHIEIVEYNVANIVPVSSSYTGSYRDGKDLSVNQECSMRFDLSLNNGHELDSFSHKFGQMYRIEDRPQQQLKDADVIVLSDSDEENIVIVSPPAAYDNNTANIGGFAFDASNIVEFTQNYEEDGGVGASGLGLFSNNSYIYDINPWQMQSHTQPEQGFQFFETDTDAANTLVDSHNSFDMAPNGYTLDNSGVEGTSIVQDISTCHARTEGLVDNLLAFGNDDSTLQIFLPSRPSGIPIKEERNEHDNISNGVQPDDWISLTLAAGGAGNEESKPGDTINPQPHIPSKEARVEPLSDAAASLLSLNDDCYNKESSNPRVGNIFSHPLQFRSVRPRLCLSIDSDSE